MPLPQPGAPAPSNRLLAALPPDELARLLPQLQPVHVSLRQVLIVPGQPITSVYFPQSGWVSMLAPLADGRSAEVGIVGTEGMVGLPLVLGSNTTSTEAMVQGPGVLLRMNADAFVAALDDSVVLRKVLLRYTQAFQEQVTQTAACNGNHAIDQRLARWLLIAHDRSSGDSFPMTQDLLALMLCVHRPGVTVAARLLQQAGLIRYAQGTMTVTDRAGLEATACECYDIVRERFNHLLGADRS